MEAVIRVFRLQLAEFLATAFRLYSGQSYGSRLVFTASITTLRRYFQSIISHITD